MPFQLGGSLAFTDSPTNIDPVYYNPASPDAIKGDWKRFTRTMQGERRGHFGPYLLEWDKAPASAQALATATDELADTREWFGVQVLPGLWEVLGHSRDTQPPVAEGVLVVLLMEDGWNPNRDPREAYVDWLNSALYASNPEALKSGIRKSLEACRSQATRKSIEAYAIDTNRGTRRQLDVDADAFTEPAPAIA